MTGTTTFDFSTDRYPHHDTLRLRYVHPHRTAAAGSAFCGAHVARQCTRAQCTRLAVGKRRLCTDHLGTRATCRADGCESRSLSQGLCVKHGAYGTCTYGGCKTMSASKKFGGRCAKHGAFGWCKWDECTTAAVLRGYCDHHFRSAHLDPLKCRSSGCGRRAARDGVCRWHGALAWCPHAGCTNIVLGRDPCRDHAAMPPPSVIALSVSDVVTPSVPDEEALSVIARAI